MGAVIGARRIRDVRVLPAEAVFEHGPDGTLYVRSPRPLGPYADRITGRSNAGPRKRRAARSWRSEPAKVNGVALRTAKTLARVRSIAQALLDRGLSAERPLAILSGNSIEHALLALAAMYSGVIYTPLSPSYSLAARRYETLRYIWEQFAPALVFASDGAMFERPLKAVLSPGTELITCSTPEHVPATAFAELLESTPATTAVDEAHSRVKPDTIAKILYTSGSTGKPKGVITTQRMLCSNQEMLRTVMQFLADEPPVLCDWLPWNHTFGGSHNFGIVLYNGGNAVHRRWDVRTLDGFATTAANLREVATTAYFNVPKGYEMLVPCLAADAGFRRHFFSRLQILFYAAAGLNQQVWGRFAGSGGGCVAGEEDSHDDRTRRDGERALFALTTGKAGAARRSESVCPRRVSS